MRNPLALAAWQKGTCAVPMWSGDGVPAGHCDKPANGPQLPLAVLQQTRGWSTSPYCHGHCCPSHGGPRDGEPIIFQDGYTDAGRPMWCAVMPDFENLQESEAGFSGDPIEAAAILATRLRS